MPHYNMRVEWTVYSHVLIEADDKEEAIRIAEEEIDLPSNSYIFDGTFKVCKETVELEEEEEEDDVERECYCSMFDPGTECESPDCTTKQ